MHLKKDSKVLSAMCTIQSFSKTNRIEINRTYGAVLRIYLHPSAKIGNSLKNVI